jgi:sterol desaturase/sphingolipid hydroxylase (fatty acid hydroxylase superfamily)
MTGQTILWAAGGALSWSFAEYAIHNWRGHHGKGRNAFSREHLAHHADGNHFAPASTKLSAASVAAAAMIAGLWPLLGLAAALPFVGGFLTAYAGYEILHRRLHTHAPLGAYGRWARRHHFHHHFMSPKKNHGVTSPVWDLLLGTYEKPDVVRVPRRHAMRWLAAEGEVLPAFAADYLLVGRAAAKPGQAQQDLVAAYAGQAPGD